MDEEADVVNGMKTFAEFLSAHLQMMEIGFRVILAGIAIAFGVKRGEVFFILSRFDVNATGRSHKSAMAGDAGWQNTVEHIDAKLDSAKDVIQRPDPHEVAGFFGWQIANRVGDHLEANVLRLANRSAADRIAWEIHLR